LLVGFHDDAGDPADDAAHHERDNPVKHVHPPVMRSGGDFTCRARRA
jgi:hypothetical protein